MSKIPNAFLRIDELWAWVASDGDGEGVLAAPIGSSTLTMPLVGADRERMESFRPVAQSMADAFEVEVKLVRFMTRTEIETLHPVMQTVTPL